MANNHSQLFNKLVERTIVSSFVSAFPESLKNPDGETLIKFKPGVEVSEKNMTDPENPRAYFRHDAIFCFRSADCEEIRLASIEIKGHRQNLLKDNKMAQYIGATDWFFLAVSNNLILPAIQRIKENEQLRRYAGLIDISKLDIVIRPQKQAYDPDRLIRILKAIKKQRWYPPEINIALLHQSSVTVPENCQTRWKNIDGLQVNEKYVDRIMEWKNKGKL